VTVGHGGTRAGLTEDYLTVSLADPTVPRGVRLRCRLVADGEQLRAIPVQEPEP
jgi:uncharacterized protein (DUF736 family)